MCVGLLSTRAAASPFTFSYGGRLADANDRGVAGPVDLEVKFYTVPSGGTPVGVSPQLFSAVALNDGVFQLDLTLAPQELAMVFSVTGDAYVEVTDHTHNVTYPRQRMTAIPYALRVPLDSNALKFDANGNLTLVNPPPAVGTAANDLVQLSSDGVLPAVDGSQLTNITASQVKGLGTLATVSPSGTPSNATYLRGDGTWATLGMFTSGGGNVGIGTTSAPYPLTVAGVIESTAGGIKFPDGSVQLSAAGSGLWAPNGSSAYFINKVGIGTSAPGANLAVQGSAGGTALAVLSNGGNADLVVKESGNVGIGSTAPQGNLDVNGTICFSGANCISSWPASMAYPPAGIPNSSGSAWGTSYSTSGSGTMLALTTSPTFTTPTLGAASATTVNGLSLTANSTGFSVAGGSTSKTLTLSNSLTLAGTDGSTLNVGAGGTLGSAAFQPTTAFQPTLTNPLTYSGSLTNGHVATFNGTNQIVDGGALPAGMTYPGSGIASSTGSAWGASYSTSGSGSVLALTSSPTFATPNIGAATATTVNGLSLVANGTGFSVAGGSTSKILTLSNSLTLAGTDGSTLNVGAGGTLGSAAFQPTTAFQATLTNPLTYSGSLSSGHLAVFSGTNQIIDGGAVPTSSQWTTSGLNIYYNSGGNVGIGTTTPTSTLQINGTVSAGPSGTGAESEAYGAGANAPGTHATALGNIASATGNYSTVLGYDAQTSSYGATLLGALTVAGGNSISVGDGANSGSNAITIGYTASGIGNGAVAMGYYASIPSGDSYSVAIGYYATTTGSNQFVAGGTHSGTNYPITDVYFGTGPSAATASVYTIHGSGGSGTDNAGAPLQLAGGIGTGAGAGGPIVFQTASPGTTGTTANSLSPRMLIDQSGNVGIGSTNPAVALDVAGQIKIQIQGVGVTPTCNSTTAGSLALTSVSVLCICNGSTWNLTSGAACTF